MSYVVKLQYFKDSGKFYSEGEYTTQQNHMFEIFTEVREKVEAGKLPGLVEGARFTTLVNVPEHPHDHPALINYVDPRNIPQIINNMGPQIINPKPLEDGKTYVLKVNGHLPGDVIEGYHRRLKELCPNVRFLILDESSTLFGEEL